MKEDSVVEYRNPGIALPVADVLTEVLRNGARELLQQAVEAEVAEFVRRHRELKDEHERQRVVRNGYRPERTIQTGIGEVTVKAPRARDRAGEIKFQSNILPAYLRRTRSIEELLPWLYLKGLSTGDFSEALAALLGKDARGLSAATISRLKEVWKGEYEHWTRRDLSGKNIVYLWVDGVHFGVRLEDASQCILVIIGATADGKKELLAMLDGYRESAESWKELLLDLKQRGLKIDPKLAVGDGALGFWKALPQVYGSTRAQRCWVHKTANVLNQLPKGQQAKAKAALHEIWMAESRAAAEQACTTRRIKDHFTDSWVNDLDHRSDNLARREELSAIVAFLTHLEQQALKDLGERENACCVYGLLADFMYFIQHVEQVLFRVDTGALNA